MSESRKADVQIGVTVWKRGKKVYNNIELFGSYQWGYADKENRYRLRVNYVWHGGTYKEKKFYDISEIGEILGINLKEMIK